MTSRNSFAMATFRSFGRARFGSFATATAALVALCLVTSTGSAQARAGAGVEGLEPPQLVTKTTVVYPRGAPKHEGPITVHVKLRVAPTGKVVKAEVLNKTHPTFEKAVLTAVTGFGFRPARYKGRAVTVEIAYAHTFLPPPKPVIVSKRRGPPRNCILKGRLREKGTRVPVQRVTISAVVAGRRFTTLSNEKGRFKLRIPRGKVRVTIHGNGYLDFLQNEKLEDSQILKVAYLVEREHYDPYQIVVHGQQRRTEVSRVTLKGREMTHVPGTFGDPFRVIQTLPGVASVMSLLPFPIVRGASPGSTGFLIDRVRVPLLFHLLAGPSVIHPDFLDEVRFHAGGFPVQYGGYTAGIVDGRTRRAQRDEKLLDVNINMLQSGLLVRHPVADTGITATAAGRIGYPGVIMSLATDQASLSYWDYQLRLDGDTGGHGWSIFAFGASDEISAVPADADPNDPEPELEPILRFTFHRLDARYLHRVGKLEGTYRFVIGTDDTLFGGNTGVRTIVGGPMLMWRYPSSKSLEFRFGIEGSARDTQQQSSETDLGNEPDFNQFTEDLTRFYVASAWVDSLWRPTEDLLVRPGVRVDWRNDGNTSQVSADPRLSWRYSFGRVTLPFEGTETKARDSDVLWVKGGVGMYHQPPRFFFPVPGLDQMPLKYGLLRAIQYTLGLETPLGAGVSVDTSVFYNDMDPVIFDLQVNRALADVRQSGPSFAPGELPPEITDPQSQAQAAIDKLFEGQQGRAYGFEVLLRKRSRNGLYGWISYTLSRSERLRNGEWVGFDFDRTHLFNVVAGLPLPRNWEIGARVQYQSGKPVTTTYGYNAARTDGYMRWDVRIDKRAVWNNWLLDFYIDISNVTLYPEEVAAGQKIRYVLPTLGFKGRL